MSTYYRPTEPISLEAIEDSDYLADVGFNVEYTKKHKYFTCEGSCIHYALNDDMEVIDLFRYGGNNAMKILNHLRYEFEVDFVSEHDEEYDDYCHEDTKVMTISIDALKKLNKKEKE
tara:strand:+ start:375 stop:725 length:351 start_codon:yes stop_codon:yes gene_type:complete